MGDTLETLRGANTALLARVAELERRLTDTETELEATRAEACEAGACEDRARLLFELMPDAMFVLDTQGQVIDRNRAAEDLLGYCGQEVISLPWWEMGLIPECHMEATMALLQRARQGMPVGPAVLPVRHKDGQMVSVELRSFPIIYVGQPAILCVARDVTAQVEREVAMQREHAQLLTILDALEQPVSVSDMDTYEVLYVNGFLERALGYDPVGHKCHQVFYGSGTPCDECCGAILRENGGVPHHWERYNAHMGRILSLTDRAIAWPGHAAARIEVAVDITDLRQVEQALRESEARYRTVLDTSPDAIIYSDRHGIVRLANHQAALLIGLENADDLLGRYLPEHVAPEQRRLASANYDRTLIEGQLRDARYDAVRVDGTRVPVEMSSSLVRDGDGQPLGLVSVVHDITQRRELEERLLQAQKMEAIGRLAGGVAHDFNNLLTVISGYTEMALDNLPPDEPARADLREIATAAKRASDLTRDLLAFSRKQMLRLEVLDLNAVLAPMGRMLQRLIGEQVALTLRLAPSLWRVRADASQLAQVVMNLAVNARDAMPEGGELTLETANVDLDQRFAERHQGACAGEFVRLRVRDTGAGMTPEVRARLFEPFYTTKGMGQGTGLGLSVVFGVVKQLGGNIYVESAPGQGATFDIYLPRVQAEDDAQAVAARDEPRGQGETILVVEDEPAVRQVLRRMLRGLGYRVELVENGLEAIERCGDGATPIHLVLTDVVMPGMNGQALADTVAQLPNPPRVLFMSGYSPEAIESLGMRPGEGRLVHKPFVREELARLVREVLDG
jgi:PAS domain S-box-containing protein